MKLKMPTITAHVCFARKPTVFPRKLSSAEKIAPMIPGKAAAAF